MRYGRTAAAAAALCAALAIRAGGGPVHAGWESLLDGQGPAGWQAQDGKPNEWFATGAVRPQDATASSIEATPAPGGVIVNGPNGRTANLVTTRKFGDVELHVEFLVPKGSNSGIYLHGLYEVQVFDSYGVPQPGVHDCGAIYERWIGGKGVGGSAPLVNASRPPGQWQTLDIRFQAPRFDRAGRKTAPARFLEVRLNGVVIQRNAAAPGPTRASMNLPEAPQNPLMLQGDHGPVAYRNIWVRPLGPPVAGEVSWTAGNAILGPLDREGETYYSLKDPSVVQAGGRWHVFCTVRGQKRSHQIEYLSFRDWADTAHPTRATLKLSDGYFCAPQVFYFRPHRKWYMIYQVVDQTRQPALQPAWSTTETLERPESWTKPALLMDDPAKGVKNWIDFWVICDDANCHLFFASLDGRMWKSQTRLADFPKGWSAPRVALQDDIYEASHTYRLKGGGYLTMIEAQGPGGRRYYKSYTADRLDGDWKPLAAWYDRAFASPANVRFAGQSWTDSFSHGELLRDGNDETLTVDPARLRLLIQGVRDEDRQGKPYGQIPWRLGLLEAR